MEPKLKPLKEFICDTCGELIKKPEDGWVEWLQEGHSKANEFRIVHHEDKCMILSDLPASSHNDLNDFLLPDGMANLLSFIDPTNHHGDEPYPTQVTGEALPQFFDFFRRLTVPHYEEARQYFNEAKEAGYFSDTDNFVPYRKDVLLNIIREFGN